MTENPWKNLLNPEIQDFIKSHENSDIRELGLKKSPNSDWPYPLVLDQIKARQKARVKLPEWASAHNGIIFPPSDVLEQASSAATARYKAGLVKGSTFVDLTAGAGVDSWALLEQYDSGLCVERDPQAAALIAHNLPLLTDKPVTVEAVAAEGFVQTMGQIDLVYIDPQRRTSSCKGLYRLEYCQPNATALLPYIRKNARTMMIKVSPMLDIALAVEDLAHVVAVHIVQWQGECKEVLYILDFAQDMAVEDIPFTAVTLDDGGQALRAFTFTKAEEAASSAVLSAPLAYLYEPGPAFLKAGGFNLLAFRFGLKKLHKNTHLYTGDTYEADFPGRAFEIIDVLPVSRKNLDLKKANLAVRNFPSDVETLKKKLGLKDGGDAYLFACTLAENQKALLHCRKAVKRP